MTPHADPSNPPSGPRSPAFLTIEEAAAVLRIGRTAAYLLARRWEATDGAEGLPVVRFGRLLRVPVHQLERLAAGDLDLTARPSASRAPEPSVSARPQQAPPVASTSRRSTRPRRDTQAALFPEAS
jgi:hypothetical protein